MSLSAAIETETKEEISRHGHHGRYGCWVFVSLLWYWVDVVREYEAAYSMMIPVYGSMAKFADSAAHTFGVLMRWILSSKRNSSRVLTNF